MISRTTDRFWKAFDALPPHVQERARVAYAVFASDPSHPSLRFKQVHASRPIYSARVGLAIRALWRVGPAPHQQGVTDRPRHSRPLTVWYNSYNLYVRARPKGGTLRPMGDVTDCLRVV